MHISNQADISQSSDSSTPFIFWHAIQHISAKLSGVSFQPALTSYQLLARPMDNFWKKDTLLLSAEPGYKHHYLLQLPEHSVLPENIHLLADNLAPTPMGCYHGGVITESEQPLSTFSYSSSQFRNVPAPLCHEITMVKLQPKEASSHSKNGSKGSTSPPAAETSTPSGSQSNSPQPPRSSQPPFAAGSGGDKPPRKPITFGDFDYNDSESALEQLLRDEEELKQLFTKLSELKRRYDKQFNPAQPQAVLGRIRNLLKRFSDQQKQRIQDWPESHDYTELYGDISDSSSSISQSDHPYHPRETNEQVVDDVDSSSLIFTLPDFIEAEAEEMQTLFNRLMAHHPIAAEQTQADLQVPVSTDPECLTNTFTRHLATLDDFINRRGRHYREACYQLSSERDSTFVPFPPVTKVSDDYKRECEWLDSHHQPHPGRRRVQSYNFPDSLNFLVLEVLEGNTISSPLPRVLARIARIHQRLARLLNPGEMKPLNDAIRERKTVWAYLKHLASYYDTDIQVLDDSD